MRFNKVEESEGLALKIKGYEDVEYCLWNDDQSELYIQSIDNLNTGTYSKLLFSVSKYKDKRFQHAALGKLNGYDVETDKLAIANDNNNGAFLKAVLRNLFPKRGE